MQTNTLSKSLDKTDSLAVYNEVPIKTWVIKLRNKSQYLVDDQLKREIEESRGQLISLPNGEIINKADITEIAIDEPVQKEDPLLQLALQKGIRPEKVK